MTVTNQTLLLYAPVPLYASAQGYLLEDQACNGLKLWADHFDHVIVMFPVAHGTPPPSWIPLKTAGVDLEHVEIVGLPTAYRPDHFLRHYAATRRQIGQLIDRAQYMSFAIGGLVGDWGAVAALEAHKKQRRFAVWADRVESEVVREEARSGKSFKARLKARLTHRPMAMLERALIRRATLGLWRQSFQHGRLFGGEWKAIGVDDGLATEHAVGACQFTHGNLAVRCRPEVVGHAFALVFGAGTQQPHQQKESHHGRHHVGQGNFPGAAMGATMAVVTPPWPTLNNPTPESLQPLRRASQRTIIISFGEIEMLTHS